MNFKKKIVGNVLLVGVLFSALTSNNTLAEGQPNDISKLPLSERQALLDLYNKDLVSGYNDGTFRPHNEITRAEFSSMLVSVMNLKDNGTKNNFYDSKTGNWHYSPLNIAYQNGLITGVGSQNNLPILKPNDKITRLEMMLILVRAYRNLGFIQEVGDSETTTLLNTFDDKNDVPSWAKKDVANALKNNITSGISASKLGSTQNGNRIQSVLFSSRLLTEKEKIVDGELFFSDVGLTYIGQIRKTDNLAHGKGKLFDANNRLVYEGDFKNNKLNGFGTTYYSNGKAAYVGAFQEDLPNGAGKIHSIDGTLLYEGNFVNGVLHGLGKQFNESGQVVYQGEFVDGNPK